METKPNHSNGSVMVVGGGIAGIQAALDLANSGFYVHLLEKSSAIGGVMSQLDKTFPTNDCSMCIISPKLVECAGHPNIELLTLSELSALEGQVGRFKATVVQHPRFIDRDKCTGCGDCATVCPIYLKNEFDEGLSSRKAVYKRYPQAVPGTYAIDKKGTSPCKAECPAHISVQGYVALVAQGKYREALQLIKEQNPLPAICGRVCDHPCESVCTRGKVDEPVAIDFIKRFVADLDLQAETRYVPEIKMKRDEKVAIIGSGPAGLSCAYYLAIEGYQVTVFEKLPVLGGMLTVGIPAYRLPRDIIEAEIQVIRDLGVAFKTGVDIGRDITIAQLREQGYKAFFLAIGAHECKILGVEGESLEGVYPGTDFLRRVNLGEAITLGDRVAVVGGGNVAMDAVRSAKRLGAARPFIVYRRSHEEMPANEEEIEECREEGIEIMTLTTPTRIMGENGRVKTIECIRMMLGEPDASGRRRPVRIPGSAFTMEVDAVIAAIGQESDWACLTPECTCTLSDWGTVRVDPLTLQTDDADIFAGGDAVTGPKTVIKAIAAGKQAAISMGRFIEGSDLKEGREKEWRAIEVADLQTEGYDRIPREQMPRLDPEARLTSFSEVQQGFSEDQVMTEAARCLACGICSECYQCVTACPANAVVHEQEPVTRVIEVGSVILAPGAKTYDPSAVDTYLYGKHPNVVTSLEFERILSASGPYMGHLMRPLDNREPKSIAWLQCVGSRNTNHCDNGYCSGVCCMYAVKEAIVAKEHSAEPLKTSIFFMDMRTYGKDFEKYYNRAKDEYGVNFVRSRIHTIDPGADGGLAITYVSEDGAISEEQFDMVVLSVGMEVDKDTVELAKKLDIELDRYHFAVTGGFEPVNTSRPGVYACGLFQGPKDIPFSVTEASAAACASAIDLADARGSQIQVRQLPPELDLTDAVPRIGVFVCNCGINIGAVVDVKEVTSYAKTLPNVVFADENLFTCSQDTQEKIRQVIAENNLNRVVVASCSPRTHEQLFQDTLKACGLNKYLFEMANIRDQDSWVHQKDPVKATEKAKDLVRMAAARAALLKPLIERPLEITQRGLVIGGGVAGLNAALSLARQGFETVLVESQKDLGGVARRINHTIDGLDVQDYLTRLIGEVQSHHKVQVLTEAQVVGFSGYKGNFVTQVQIGPNGDRQKIEHGVTIVATGGREYQPKEFQYGSHRGIMTQLELDKMIRDRETAIARWERVFMIQCVGSRNEENPNCSRICCQGAVKHALELKKLNPDMEVVILYRDMRTYGLLEDYYTEARSQGVLFCRFLQADPPQVNTDGDDMEVAFVDHVLKRPVKMKADAVILSAATVAADTHELATFLKVPRNAEGFFIEAHAKLRPVDFSSEGIYLCGLAHGPKLISESISQALAAASRAGSFLAATDQTIGGVVAHVDQAHCAACLVCVTVCPYGVPRINEENVSEINEALCQGCGVCASECPAGAIQLAHYEDDQIMIKVETLLEGVL